MRSSSRTSSIAAEIASRGTPRRANSDWIRLIPSTRHTHAHELAREHLVVECAERHKPRDGGVHERLSLLLPNESHPEFTLGVRAHGEHRQRPVEHS